MNTLSRNINILMLCYYFPPITDVGSKRSLAFAKYFKAHGWMPTILSVKNPDKAYCSVGSEKPPADLHTIYTYSILSLFKITGKMNGLLVKVAKRFAIEIKHNPFYQICCIPDHFWGWIPLTLLKAYHLIKKNHMDVIYVSCSPFSAALTGVLLKKITGKFLVIDFRDPFALDIATQNPIPDYRKKINRAIEHYILTHADLFVVTTLETRKAYMDAYPAQKDKIVAVHNGFEHHETDLGKMRKYEKFTIVYAGQFYLFMHPLRQYSDIFFEALLTLKREGNIDSDNFQFIYYGDAAKEIKRISEIHNVVDLVHTNPGIPYSDIIKVIKQSHLQLLRIAKPMISTKLYEGIALNVPLLATIPKGEVEDIIKAFSPASYVITNLSSQDVCNAIKDAMKKYKKNEIQNNHVDAFLDNFSRQNLSLKLMGAITQSIQGMKAIKNI